MPDPYENNSAFPSLVRLAKTLPKTAAEMVKGKYACWKSSQHLIKNHRPFGWKELAAQSVRDQLERRINDRNLMRDNPQYHHEIQAPRSQEEQNILHLIKTSTREANRSNITRTKAYYDCYLKYPELHWAFLAHMVSRNAGWNMSDLKGGLMSDLVQAPLKEDMYRMLERSNALIFQDAYPQLLLYSHSRRLGRSLFHLLPGFNVSDFMIPFWERFWIERDSALLAVGLIINEQNYIEGRVVQNSYFQKKVLCKTAFSLHSKFQMNQVIFPMLMQVQMHSETDNLTPGESDNRNETGDSCRGMVGLIIDHFSNLHERIEFGKALYAMLFGYEDVLSGVQAYASSVEHRGSRNEYWPKLFTTDKKKALNSPQESTELLKQEWLPSGKRIYSPLLNDVWQDMSYEPIPRYDWFKSIAAAGYLTRPKRPVLIEMSHAHRYALQKTAITHDAQWAIT